MKLGAYTAVLRDTPLREALAILHEMGLESAEINSGGFLPAAPQQRFQLRQRRGKLQRRDAPHSIAVA